MRQFKTRFVLLISLLLVFSGVSGAFVASAATNDYVTIAKSVNPASITTEEEAEVTLEIQGTPPANVVVPNDVVLIIDKSGSMGTTKMQDAKNAAKGFIDLMDLSIHRVGIVDFSSKSDIHSFALTTDGAAAKQYIDGIFANGSTATGDAIAVAQSMLENHRPEAHPVIVILTDGDATEPSNNPYGYAKQMATAAKEAGIIFYTIALLNVGDNPDTSGPNILLKEMATTASHHHFVLGSTGLSEIYAAIVQEIGMASAYDLVVTDTVSPSFEIVPGSYDNNIPKPTVNGNSLVWEFNELKNSKLTFKYKIRPINKSKTGNFNVGADPSNVVYKDYAGATRSKQIPNAVLKVTYPAPIITSIVEPSGSPVGGQSATIYGSNFLNGATVRFGSQYATNVNVISATEIQVTVPAGTQGITTVTVTNPDGKTATGEYQYIIDPVVNTITPNNGPLEGGNTVDIYGKYFMPGIQVSFGSHSGIVTFNNGLSFIKVKVPAATDPGAVDVTLTNPDGTTVTVPAGYTYNEPPKVVLTVTKINPKHGELAGGTLVYIDGTKFEETSRVYFGNNEATLQTYMGANRIVVKSPAATSAGAVEVRVVNSDGETATVADGFTYDAPPELPAPSISKINPNSGLMAGGYVAYIDGANFVSGAKVYFGNNQAQVNSSTATRLAVTVPASNVAEAVDIRVVNPDGKEAALDDGFTYLTPPPPPAPTITKVNPNNGPAAGGTVVYIDGTNFVTGAKVYLGNQLSNVQSLTPNRILILSPSYAQGGQVDVKVVNPDGQEAIAANGYTYIVPAPEPVTVTKVNPNTSVLSGGSIVYIDGTGFKSGAKVTFGSTTVNATFMSATRVSAVVPPAVAEGIVDVTVTNTDGMSGTLPAAFTYTAPTPTITRVNPTNVPMAGGTLVYIDGTNFESNMQVTINGINVAMVGYHPSRISVIAPASTVSGPVPITITLVSGKSASATLTYDAPPPTPAPTITKINSTGTAPSGGYLAYIDGTNFVTGLKVFFGTTEARVNTVVPNRVSVFVPAGEVGTVQVRVVNPDGQSSNLFDFTYQ